MECIYTQGLIHNLSDFFFLEEFKSLQKQALDYSCCCLLASGLQRPSMLEDVALTCLLRGRWAECLCSHVCLWQLQVTWLASCDVTWIDLFSSRWQDADWRESSAVGLRFDQIRAAGCGVLCTVVANIKQSGVPIRYEGAAWHGEDWRWSVTQNFTRPFLFRHHCFLPLCVFKSFPVYV